MTRSALLLLLCFVLAGVGGCHGDKQNSGAAKPASGQTSTGEGKSAQAKTGAKDGHGDSKDGSVPANTVRIAREDQGRAGIRVGAVTARSMPRLLTVAGQVAMDEKHTEHIGALADGRIESVYVLPGDAVHRGQTLATLHSHMVHETVAALTQAFAAADRQQSALKFANQANDRYVKLYTIQAASLEEKQRAEQEVAQQQKGLTDAEANVRAEREHLAELLQVPPESLQPGTLYNKELIPVRAVADGVVITRNVTPGQVVSTGDETFVTSNLSTVWVNAAVNEKDLSAIPRRSICNSLHPGGKRRRSARQSHDAGGCCGPADPDSPCSSFGSQPGHQVATGDVCYRLHRGTSDANGSLCAQRCASGYQWIPSRLRHSRRCQL